MYHQSKIIVSQNLDKSYLIKLLGLNDVEIEKSIIETEEQSISIKDIELLSEKVNKKSDNLKLILIINSEKLTPEAQNSLLKTLEEPAPNSLIVLPTKILEKLLETIKSRCEILYDEKSVEDLEATNLEYIFKDFATLEYIEKIKIVEKFLKDYNNKNSYKKAVIVILNELAKKRIYLDKLSKIEKAYKAIDVNVSPKLIFDYIALLLEKD